jgi:fermentation-respiration switch protein FrsA (DUF1100 family)
MKRYVILKIVSGLCAVGLAACNHLFYYPHKDIYLTPNQAKLHFREIQINSGNERILGWHIDPVGAPKKVAVLQFHGNAENRSTHFLSLVWLAQQGVDVIVFDYRGYDGSTGVPSRDGLVEDGVAALNWFAREFPGHRRYVIGQSLGGAVAIPALARTNAQFDGLILESTFATYRGIARRKLAGVWLTWPFQWLPWVLLSGNQNPIDFSGKVTVPVLAFHDRHDPVVPYESGMELYQAFPSHQVQIQTIEGELHAAAFADARSTNKEIALQFMKISK